MAAIDFSTRVLISEVLVSNNSINITSDDTTLNSIQLIDRDNVESLSLPSLTDVTNSVIIQSNNILDTVDLPNLSTIGTALSISANPILSSLNLDAISTVGTTINISDITMSSQLDLSTLLTVGSSITITNNNSIPSVDLSSLTDTTGTLEISGNSALLAITLNPSLNLANSSLNIIFINNDLTTASVDQILARVDGWNQSNGNLDFTSDAYPSGNQNPTGGNANVNAQNLFARGWNVTLADGTVVS